MHDTLRGMTQLLIFLPLPKTIPLARDQRVPHASLWGLLHIKTITGDSGFVS